MSSIEILMKEIEVLVIDKKFEVRVKKISSTSWNIRTVTNLIH